MWSRITQTLFMRPKNFYCMICVCDALNPPDNQTRYEGQIVRQGKTYQTDPRSVSVEVDPG